MIARVPHVRDRRVLPAPPAGDGVTPSPAPSVAGDGLGTGDGSVHEREVAAIAGDLDRLLDEVYHWAMRAHGDTDPRADDGVQAGMLQLATEDLRHFIATLLEHVQPIDLVRTATPTSHLAATIALCAPSHLGGGSVFVAEGPEVLVSVDLRQLARAWSGILRYLRAQAAGGGLRVTVSRAERAGSQGVEIALQPTAEPHLLEARDPVAELEWALARRIVALHGGDVRAHGAPRARTVVVFLPTRA
jgi:hypothetical protein